MANIVLLSLYDRNAYGQRLMSASLKRSGHACHIIFLKRYQQVCAFDGVEVAEHSWTGVDNRGRKFRYGPGQPITLTELELLRRVLERLRPDVIGMTVNTPLRVQNTRVTQFIKTFSNAPVIWGGYDPTVTPADCLGVSDYACIGEGDRTILEIAQCADRGEPLDLVPNLTYRRNGLTITNELAPLVHDLDTLPWRDNDPENKHFIEDDSLTENCQALNDRKSWSYQAMTSRGCPYRCTYCCEALLKQIYAGQKFLRRRSPQDCVAELAETKARFGIAEVVFEDEIFGMDHKWLSEFAPLYRQKVGLPFHAYLYPTRNIDKLLPLLKHAGLAHCCIALQSGSARINRGVFDRVYDRKLFLKTVRLCRELGITFYTDVITYNPYEEECDLQDTLEVLLEMKGGYDLLVNKLFVLPGTALADRMRRDGKAAGDPVKDRRWDYYSRLFWVASFSPYASWAVRLVRCAGIFRLYPALLNLAVVESVLRCVERIAASRQRGRWNWLSETVIQCLSVIKAWVSRAVKPRRRTKLLDGWHQLEAGAWHWTERRFSVAIEAGKRRTGALKLRCTLPELVFARLGAVTITARCRDSIIFEQTLSAPDDYECVQTLGPEILAGGRAVVYFALDKWLPPDQNDHRERGLIVQSVTFE